MPKLKPETRSRKLNVKDKIELDNDQMDLLFNAIAARDAELETIQQKYIINFSDDNLISFVENHSDAIPENAVRLSVIRSDHNKLYLMCEHLEDKALGERIKLVKELTPGARQEYLVVIKQLSATEAVPEMALDKLPGLNVDTVKTPTKLYAIQQDCLEPELDFLLDDELHQKTTTIEKKLFTAISMVNAVNQTITKDEIARLGKAFKLLFIIHTKDDRKRGDHATTAKTIESMSDFVEKMITQNPDDLIAKLDIQYFLYRSYLKFYNMGFFKIVSNEQHTKAIELGILYMNLVLEQSISTYREASDLVLLHNIKDFLNRVLTISSVSDLTSLKEEFSTLKFQISGTSLAKSELRHSMDLFSQAINKFYKYKEKEFRNSCKLNLRKHKTLTKEQLIEIKKLVNITQQSFPHQNKFMVEIDKNRRITVSTHKNTLFDPDTITFSVIKANDGNLYVMHETLGVGGQGRVKMSLSLTPNESGEYELVPVKIQLNSSSTLNAEIKEKLKFIKGELLRTTKNGIKEYMLMQYIPGKTINNVLYDNYPKNTVSVYKKLLMAISACDEVSKLHQLGILHRDLKSLNIMFEDSANLATLIDYDLSTTIANPDTYGAGTRGFYAPEIDPSKVTIMQHSTQSDIYALGKTLEEIFSTHSNDDRGEHEELNEAISFMKIVIENMTAEDPKARWPLDVVIKEMQLIFLMLNSQNLLDKNDSQEMLYQLAMKFFIKNMKFELGEVQAQTDKPEIITSIQTLLIRVEEIHQKYNTLSVVDLEDYAKKIKDHIMDLLTENPALTEKLHSILEQINYFDKIIAKKSALEASVATLSEGKPVLLFVGDKAEDSHDKAVEVGLIRPSSC